MIVGIAGVVIGLVLFVLLFGAAFAGSMPALVVFAAAYPLIAAMLVRWRDVPVWLPAAALVAPALPFVAQFGLALLFEEGPIAALIWPGGAALVFGLSLAASLIVRRPPSRYSQDESGA